MDRQNLKNSKILVVDNHPENIRILKVILKELEFNVRGVADGHTAIEAIKKDLPDLILLDIVMPEIDGFEICKVLKEDEQLKEIPIIFINSHLEIKNSIRGFDVGGVDYITKPFDKSEVITKITTHLTFAWQSRKIQEYSEIMRKESIDLQIKYLIQTVDDFRSYFDRNRVKQLVSVDRLIEQSLNIININSKIKIQISSNCKRKIDTNPKGLIEVIVNILQNAKDIIRKREIEKGTIFIKLDESDKFTTITISDNGGGISQKLLSKIGKKEFETKDNRVAMGIYISKLIIENRLNGKLEWYNSDIGACFKIKLPF